MEKDMEDPIWSGVKYHFDVKLLSDGNKDWEVLAHRAADFLLTDETCKYLML